MYVGCLHPLLILNASQLVELLTESLLFDQDNRNPSYSHELHLQNIVELLGPFPPEFVKDCEDREKYTDEKGESNLINYAPPRLMSSLRHASSHEQ